MKLPHWLQFDKWETVYATTCKVSAYSIFTGYIERVNTDAKIQIDFNKNKFRYIISAAGITEIRDISELCHHDSRAKEICKKYDIKYIEY